MKDTAYLENMARQLRRDVVTMVHLAGDGHPGPTLSVADIVTALYFNILRIDPARPDWPQRDRFILSKGHACPVVYAALARRGYIDVEVLPGLRCLHSMLQGHPDMHKTPGIDMTSGSLGNGISVGLGMAVAGQYNGDDYMVYVITGDGELQEGIVWEAAMAAVRFRAGRLVVFVDHNGLQSAGEVSKVSGLLPIRPKFESFGWHCQEIDGHDFNQILDAVEGARQETQRPSMILAHTIKGKGVPFMENDNSWHKRVPTKEQLEAALEALK
jgi:transketolase